MYIYIYIDSSTVVFDANDILANGFKPSSWEARADGDLWALTAAELISRPNESIQRLKVKAHSSPAEAVDSFHHWLIAGNAAVDRLAKLTLALCKREPPSKSNFPGNLTCSQLLHQMSLYVRETVKEVPKENMPRQICADHNDDFQPLEETQPWQFQQLAKFDSQTWCEKWLQLVQHYYAFAAVAQFGAEKARPHFSVEIMRGLCLRSKYQSIYSLPSSRDVPVLAPKAPAKYCLPTRQMRMVLPPEGLKQTSHTRLRTLDFLQKTLRLAPVERESLRSLAPIGHSNVIPSLRISPVLLSGLHARNLLIRILTPGIRVLKCSYRLPVMQPRAFPATFLPTFRILKRHVRVGLTPDVGDHSCNGATLTFWVSVDFIILNSTLLGLNL